MKAVNLMPSEARSSRGGASSLGPAHAVLGGLAAIAVGFGAVTVVGKQVDDREVKLAGIEAQATAAEAAAQANAPYTAFSALAQERVGTVKALDKTRFDWSHAMQEISRVLPANVWLDSMTGESGAAEGASPNPATNVAPAPSFVLEGCTTGQTSVARLMARLRAVDGVSRVELQKSEKPTESASVSSGGQSGGAAPADTGGCPANKPSNPTFSMSVHFGVPGAGKPSVTPDGRIAPTPAAPAPGATPAPPANGSTDPAQTASQTTTTPAPGGQTS